MEKAYKVAVVGATGVVGQEMLKILFENKATVDIKDQMHNTALHWAVHYGRVDNVDILLKYKANPNIKSHSGYTALHRAIRINAPKNVILKLNKNSAIWLCEFLSISLKIIRYIVLFVI